MAFCTSCGTKLPEGAAWCGECGTRIETQASTADAEAAQQASTADAEAAQQASTADAEAAQQASTADAEAAQQASTVEAPAAQQISSAVEPAPSSPETPSSPDAPDANARSKSMGVHIAPKPHNRARVSTLVFMTFLGLFVIGAGGFAFWSLLQKEPELGEPIAQITVTPNQSASLGELAADGVSIELPDGSFAAGDQLTLSPVDPDSLPGVDSARFQLAGQPIDLSLDGRDFTRTGEPVTLTFQLDPEMVERAEDPSFIQLGYYFDGEWFLSPMESVDLKAQTATARVRHLCKYSPTLAERAEIEDQLATELATSQWEREHNKKAMRKAIHDPLEKLIISATGVKDPSVIKAIVEEAAGQSKFTSALKVANDISAKGLDSKSAQADAMNLLAQIAAEKLTKKVGADVTDFGGDVGNLAATAEGGSQVLLGDGRAAAETISKALLSNTGVGKLFIAAHKVGTVAIGSWKKNGIEELYEAYRDGSDGKNGIEARAGEFEFIIQQSDSVIRQVRIDAAKEHCRVKGMKDCKLSTAEEAALGDLAVARLHESFVHRQAEEEEIAENKKRAAKLIESITEAGLDKTAKNNPSFKGLEYDRRLQRMINISRNIEQLSGRKLTWGLIDSDEDRIADQDVTMALRMWLSKSGGKQAALDYLKEKGLLAADAKPAVQRVVATGVLKEMLNWTNKGKVISSEVAFHGHVTVEFWNVGSQVPGKGGIKVTIRDLEDDSVSTGGGTFSGGPNGVFKADGETYRLVGGRSIPIGELGALTVKNPDAFDRWR